MSTKGDAKEQEEDQPRTIQQQQEDLTERWGPAAGGDQRLKTVTSHQFARWNEQIEWGIFVRDIRGRNNMKRYSWMCNTHTDRETKCDIKFQEGSGNDSEMV